LGLFFHFVVFPSRILEKIRILRTDEGKYSLFVQEIEGLRGRGLVGVDFNFFGGLGGDISRLARIPNVSTFGV
jgi:hypothetical protein